ncbi:MAG TPA: dienelactone hydrolase family protein, partial [Pseudomonadales bacterium]|nr:dienelactone hydrolase family protein [Pseudomonadales bacterium]
MSGTIIEFSTAAGGNCQGYLSIPAAGKGPAVIVIQEWWGLVDHIKQVADR